MTTPSIYRITTITPTQSPGSGQFLGYQIINGSLVPNPNGGIFSESLGSVLSGASDYLDKGLQPTIPSALIQGLSVITKADDYTKVATNLLAGKSYEAAIARGEAQGGALGALVGAGVTEAGILLIGGAAAASSGVGLFVLGGGAVLGSIFVKQGSGAAAGAEWIRDNAPKLNNGSEYDAAVTVNGIGYVAVLGTDTNGGPRTFYYAKTDGTVDGQRYRVVGDADVIKTLQAKTLEAIGYDSSITFPQWLVQNGRTASGLDIGGVAYVKTDGPVTITGSVRSEPVIQVTTYRDEVSNAAVEIRLAGKVIGGVFTADTGSIPLRIGMDAAGRQVLFDDTARAALNNLSTANGQFGQLFDGQPIRIAVQPNSGNGEIAEIRSDRGDVAWVLPHGDGERTVVVNLKNGIGFFPAGATVVGEFNKDNTLKANATIYDKQGNDITESVTDDVFRIFGSAPTPSDTYRVGLNQSGGFLLASGPTSYVWQDETYTKRADGYFARNLGEGQSDVIDPTSGKRFLETGDVRVPVGRDQSISLSSDTGLASVAPRFQFDRQSLADSYSVTPLTDANGTVIGSKSTVTFDNGTTLASIRDQNGQLLTTTEINRSPDGNLLTEVKDGAGKVLSSTATEFFYDDAGVSRIETVTTPNSVLRNAFDTDGTLASSTPVDNGLNNIGRTLSTTLDFLSLVRAIQTGQPLALLASGLRLANTLSNGANLELSGASNAASGILSLLSLNAALERGDTLGIVTAGTQTIAFGAQSLSDFAASQAFNAIDAGGFDEAAVALSLESGALAQTLGEALPYLNLVNGIINGDPVGIATGVLMLIPGGQPFAIALTVANLIFSLWDDEGTPYVPPPYGTGRFAWSSPGADTSLKFETAGERGGDQAVSNVMTNVLATLNAVIERQRQQNPGSALGIIANRMPGISYDAAGYRYTDINPLTGEEKHPELRFDTSGRPYNATPGSPESFQSITEGIVRSALARGAIAPMWEVQTAKLQNDAGDPKAGLSEEERAGRDGQLAASITGTTQAFRAVTLDLDGDGLETSTRAAGVAFDVDDSGYLKQTAWVKPDDGFLVLDRNLNDTIDSGKELFANGTVALNRRGLAGMAWADSNYDGKLSPSDPVWAELKVWQDLNQNGSRDAGEAETLTALGITELNYAMGTFTQVNAATGATQVKQLASPDLEADKDGTRVTVVPEGILVQARSDYYKNRSCLRMYSLGCSTKRSLRTGKNCEKRACRKAGKENGPQKQTFLGIKRSQSRLFMCVISYEIYSEAMLIEAKEVAL